MINIVTINEVAKEAGVSITTVSRVLNNNYPVKEETRKRVEEAIKKLNFKPNQMARGLITKKSSIIGILVPSITNWFFSSTVEDMERELKSKGYHIHLSTTGGDAFEERAYIKELEGRCVDGIIVMDPNYENIVNGFYEEISSRIPLIITNSYNSEVKNNCSFISYDENNGMSKAVERLRMQGKERIALLRGKVSQSFDIREKLYLALVKSEKLKYKNIITVENGNSLGVIKGIKSMIHKLYKDKDNFPNGIIACNDLMAAGLISSLKELGLTIPEDVAVIGYDNTPLCDITSPSITTVDLSIEHLGKRAVTELMDLIENGLNIRKNIILDTRLITRESC